MDRAADENHLIANSGGIDQFPLLEEDCFNSLTYL